MLRSRVARLAALPLMVLPRSRPFQPGSASRYQRSGIAICGGLPRRRDAHAHQVVPFTRAEQDLLIGWQDSPACDAVAGQEAAPPRRGNFLIKVGGRPGIRVPVALTPTELALNDTNKRWHQTSRIEAAAEFAERAA